MKQVKYLSKDYYTSYEIHSSFHVATHLDLPRHLIEDERLANDFPLDQFYGNGILLDVRGQAVIEWRPSYENKILKGDMVLLYTDTVRYLQEPDHYFNRQPTLSLAFAEKLVEKGIKLLGMDMPSPDYPPFLIHKRLLENDIVILENLQQLEKLVDEETFTLMTFPLKVEAEASFVRAVAQLVSH